MTTMKVLLCILLLLAASVPDGGCWCLVARAEAVEHELDEGTLQPRAIHASAPWAAATAVLEDAEAHLVRQTGAWMRRALEGKV